MTAPYDQARRQPGSEANTHDAPIIGHDDAEGKRLDRLRAIAALNVMAVYDSADRSYLVCRWGLSRAVPSVNALSQLFAQMGMSA